MSNKSSAAPRTVDVLSVLGFSGLIGVGLLRIDAALAPIDVLWLALGGMAGVLAADLATGLVHALGDRCFEEDTPWIGPSLIQPFREHHVDPQAITRHGFFEVTGNNALVTLPVAAWVAVAAPSLGAGPLTTAAFGFGVCFGLVAVASNMFHRWAHMRDVPRLVGWLQERRLILSPRHHGRHHRAAHDQNYCVATGWMNPVVDRLGWLRSRAPNSPPQTNPSAHSTAHPIPAPIPLETTLRRGTFGGS